MLHDLLGALRHEGANLTCAAQVLGGTADKSFLGVMLLTDAREVREFLL
jgi:hypothetical protein